MEFVQRIRQNKRGLVAAAAATGPWPLRPRSPSVASVPPSPITRTFLSATIQLEEGTGATTCYSTGTGSGGTVSAANSSNCGINILTGTLDQVPGGAGLTTTITLTNVGNHNATVASLVAGACAAAAASDDAIMRGVTPWASAARST